MGKLFLFGIGGTVSRVLRSLTMLLASGVKIDADEIVPIIIDADHANKDLTRTIELIKNPDHNIMLTLLAPEFTTCGQLIYNAASLSKIYETGQGSFKVRAKYRYDKRQAFFQYHPFYDSHYAYQHSSVAV